MTSSENAVSPSTIPARSWVVREIARGGLAGLSTGVLVGGVGGRLAMRLSALVDPSANGLTTEAGRTVGEITFAGTFEFIFFVGIFSGITVAFVWMLISRWLPEHGNARYRAAAVVAVAMGGRASIGGNNFDFRILDPAVGQAAIFVGLAALGGVTVVIIDRFLERRLPPAEGAAWTGYIVVALLGTAFAFPILLSYFSSDACGCRNVPWLVGILLIAVGVIRLVGWIGGLRDRPEPSWLRPAGTITVVATTVAGLVHLGGEIAHFV